MRQPTLFDRFPNELLYEVFQYLTTYDILYAFKEINRRIDLLLKNYVRYDLNFQSWPKSKFDFVREFISPEQIRSLILSDDDDTVRQIHVFFRSFYIRRCVNLKLLTLYQINEQDWNKIVKKLHYLSNLTYLSIKSFNHLVPPTVQISLKSLTVGVCTMNELHQWLSCTPMLINLAVELIANESTTNNNFHLNPIGTDIRRLKVKLPEKSNITYQELATVFVCMSKLEVLTSIAVKGFRLMEGNQWEYHIRRHLPQLKDFHFKIQPSLNNIDVTQVFTQFQTPFWIHEHQWSIQCDYYNTTNVQFQTIKNIHLYTLPYCDDEFYLTSSASSLTQISKDAYQTIKHLYFCIDHESYSHLINRYYFPNLDSLTICNLHVFHPLNSLIDLGQIKHLTIEQNNTIHPEEFLSQILNYSLKLHSLKISWHSLIEITRDFTDQQICSLLSKQIKYLHVFNSTPQIDKHKCKPIDSLIKIFSKNLEKLHVHVQSLDVVPLLLHHMFKLNSMIIEYNSEKVQMNNDELFIWLTENVSRLKNFTYQIRAGTKTTAFLLLWIGH